MLKQLLSITSSSPVRLRSDVDEVVSVVVSLTQDLSLSVVQQRKHFVVVSLFSLGREPEEESPHACSSQRSALCQFRGYIIHELTASNDSPPVVHVFAWWHPVGVNSGQSYLLRRPRLCSAFAGKANGQHKADKKTHQSATPSYSGPIVVTIPLRQ